MILAAYRGREEEATAAIDASVSYARASGVGWNLGAAAYSRALLSNGLGRYRDALAAAQEAVEFEDLAVMQWALTELVEAAARSGADDVAAAGCDRLVARTSVVDSPWARGTAAYADALTDTSGEVEKHWAQRHPGDFDGILANAPAISWDRFAVGDLWPYVVMNEEDNHLSPCKLNAFTTAATAACDGDDGAIDGIVGNAIACDFDSASLVGETVLCDGAELTISARDAAVVEKIWDGPRAAAGKRLWFGLTPTANLGYLAGPAPFPVASSWVQSLLVKDPAFDVSTITYADYERLFAQSVDEYHKVIGSDDTDMSGLRRSGAKLLTWHGGDDQLVPLAGTLRYRQNDHAPTTLAATAVAADGTTTERDICLYPRTSHLSRDGFTCR